MGKASRGKRAWRSGNRPTDRRLAPNNQPALIEAGDELRSCLQNDDSSGLLRAVARLESLAGASIFRIEFNANFLPADQQRSVLELAEFYEAIECLSTLARMESGMGSLTYNVWSLRVDRDYEGLSTDTPRWRFLDRFRHRFYRPTSREDALRLTQWATEATPWPRLAQLLYRIAGEFVAGEEAATLHESIRLSPHRGHTPEAPRRL